ncbi:MAG: DUF3310 domain-containing protein [candidate division Zixibacteria bacterium]|nr:DUF3310 domain-containing protein [candidate division Zixibacteria bacterium]
MGSEVCRVPKFHPPVSHYNRGMIQPIDFMESNFTPDEYRGFLKGQVIKYISRYRYKGSPIADLAKAQTYILWLLEFEENRSASEINKDKK